MALDNFSSYTEALAAWLASDCQDESHLLQGKALEDAKKLIGCRSLSEQDYQFLITSQELEKRELLKKLEIARQATQDVNQKIANFLANTRTELATPINCIISSLKIIIDGVTDSLEEDQAFINHAYECALDTLNQVNDLLDIANEYKMVHSIKLDPTPQIPPNVDPCETQIWGDLVSLLTLLIYCN